MAVTATQVQNLYLAYFGRPAEPAGLTYWTAQTSATVDQISAAFAQQPEYTATYGSLTRAQTINTLYQNLFGRAAQSNELAYWNSSTDVTIDKLALALTNGATGTDRLTLDNKVQFATSVTTASASTASVQDVNSLFNQSVTINGTPYASVGAYVAATATATSGVSAAQAAAQYYAAANTSLQAIINPTLNGASSGFTADFKAQTAGTIKLDGAVGPDAIVIGATATSNKATSVAFTGNTNGAETLTLTEAAAAGSKIVDTLTFNVSSIDTSTTAANKVLTLVATDLTALKTIDASASSVGFASDVSSLANLSSLKTGAGADTLTVATTATGAVALTVDTGAGNDTVTATVGSAALTVNTGDGVDVLTLTTGNANLTVNAGAGNDLVTLNAVASTAGTTHTAVIDLGAGNDTLKVAALTNLHNVGTPATGTDNATATLLAQDLIKVSNFGAGDKLDLSSGVASFQALSTTGAANVAQATTLLAAATAAAADVTAAAGGNAAAAHTTTFQFGGNTYVLGADLDTGIGAGDGLIELTGYQGSFAVTAGATGVLTAA